MNYGQYETERRLKSLSSKTGKYTSKLVFNIFKAFFIKNALKILKTSLDVYFPVLDERDLSLRSVSYCP